MAEHIFFCLDSFGKKNLKKKEKEEERQWGRNIFTNLFNIKLVIKRTGILLYRGNLNKGKIYTRRIYNTDRKSVLERDEKSEW